MVRVVVIQLESAPAQGHSLDLCTQLIDRALLEHAPAIVLFPELVVDDEHDLSVEGALGARLSERALRHQVWLIGAVQQRGLSISISASPTGEFSSRPGSELEQTGAGAFAPESAIIVTEHGKVGLIVGPQALHFKVARALALAGADLLCASLAPRADAEIALRSPARAAENELFFAISAHTPTEPPALPYPLHLETLPPELAAAQERVRAPVSQIFAPSGRQLACGPLACAELSLLDADTSEAHARPRLTMRRPDLYRGLPLRAQTREQTVKIDEIDTAALAFSELGSVNDAIAWAREHIEELAAREVSLVVLPELFCFDPNLTDLHGEAADQFPTVVQALARACRRTGTHVVTSLVERLGDAYFHMGVVVGQGGVVLRQPQLHVTEQRSWASPGARLETARMPWGKLALLLAEDALVPELLDGVGRAQVELLAAPLSARLARLATLTLSAASDEAGYAVVGSTRPEYAAGGQLVSSSFVVEPSRWPAQTALGEQEVLRGRIGLAAIRDARLLSRGSRTDNREARLRVQTPTPELALD